MIDVRPFSESDWPAVRAIFGEGIATGNATFETEAPDWDGWDARFLPRCRLVAEVDGAVAGWAALSPYSRRPAYSGVGDISVYVAGERRGRGVGSALLERLVSDAAAADFWTLQAGIFPENKGSLALHERHGFRVVGRRERIGRHAGRWRDVLLLERRL